MEFRKPGNRSLQTEDADVLIRAPRKELYADLIEGQWCWVNGCPECHGEEPRWAYIKCDKHDVCITCRTPRKELTEIPWGHRKGFQCKPCADAEHKAERNAALARVANKEYDALDYLDNDRVVCPHCEHAYDPDGEVPEGEETCELCGGVFRVEPEYSVTFSTEVVGERVTIDNVDEQKETA